MSGGLLEVLLRRQRVPSHANGFVPSRPSAEINRPAAERPAKSRRRRKARGKQS